MSEAMAAPLIPQLQEMQHQQQNGNVNNGSPQQSMQQWPGYSAWYANQSAGYPTQFSQYYQYYLRYGMQQQQQQQQQSGVTSVISSSNAPPGFGNAVITSNDKHLPPLPSGPPPPPPPPVSQNNCSNGNNSKNFGGIRFNLNQQKRLMNAPNPLQHQQQQNANFSFNQNNVNINNINMNGNNGKKKRKRNKSKNNQMQQHHTNFGDQFVDKLHENVLNESNLLNTSVPPPPPPPIISNIDLSKPPPPINNYKFDNDGPSASQEKKNDFNESTVVDQQQQEHFFSSSGGLASVESATANSSSTGTYKKSNAFHNPNDTWPKSLNNFVARCYAKCTTDLDKDQIDICLKGKIIAAANRNELWTRDWDNEPLPTVFSERNNINIKTQQQQQPQKQRLPYYNNNSNKNMQQNNSAEQVRNNYLGKGLSRSLNSRLGQRNSVKLKVDSRSELRNISNKSSHKRSSRSRSTSSSPSRSRKMYRSSSNSSSSSQEQPSENCVSISNLSSTSFTNKRMQNLANKRKKYDGDSLNNSSCNTFSSLMSASMLNKPQIPFYASSVGGLVDDDTVRLQQRAARFCLSSGVNDNSKISSPLPSNIGNGHTNNNNMNFGPNKNHKKFGNNRITYFVDTELVDSENSNVGNGNGITDVLDFHIVGTCRELEKSFLRLTKAPQSSEVRPLDVLVLSLENVKQKWRNNQDYFYACDQLKSIRQDLTVQGIRDKFTVEVYETHARIAMEKGDHEEFNQCQTQLRMLYMEIGSSGSTLEFIAYRILYYIFTKNTLDTTTVLRSITQAQRENPIIAYALEFRSAWAKGNYCKLFQLYKRAPLMSGHLIDWFIERERKAALRTIIKAYRPHIGVSYLKDLLAFESLEKCQEWLSGFKLPYVNVGSVNNQIDCKIAASTMTI